jgi:hypothetical protein
MIQKMEINATAILKKAWQEMSGQIALYAALTGVYGVVVWACSMVPFVNFLVTAPLGFGLTICLQKMRKKQDFGFEDFFWGFRDFNRYLHGLILGALITGGIIFGMILLIIPGIWFLVAGAFSATLFVLFKADGIEAIKKSMDLVKGRWWNIAGFLAVLGLINILGLLCFFVGILITAPLSALSVIIAVESLLEEEKALSPTPMVTLSTEPVHPEGS